MICYVCRVPVISHAAAFWTDCSHLGGGWTGGVRLDVNDMGSVSNKYPDAFYMLALDALMHFTKYQLPDRPHVDGVADAAGGRCSVS